MTYCVKTHRVHHSVVTMVTMMTQRLAMMADTNGMKELIESAIQDINTKYSYNTTTINDNYVLASLPEDCFYEVKSVSGTDPVSLSSRSCWALSFQSYKYIYQKSRFAFAFVAFSTILNFSLKTHTYTNINLLHILLVSIYYYYYYYYYYITLS